MVDLGVYLCGCKVKPNTRKAYTRKKKKLKQKLGLSKADYCLSGAAPLASSLIKWYETIGITIYQVYGMTEDCIISHANMPGSNKIGSVGKSWSTVKIKLSEEGEIRIKNNCMFTGYFKAPDITAEVFDEEGYFKTGDIWHLEKADELRQYLQQLKTWIHKEEGRL